MPLKLETVALTSAKYLLKLLFIDQCIDSFPQDWLFLENLVLIFCCHLPRNMLNMITPVHVKQFTARVYTA